MTISASRERLDIDPRAILAVLPSMGRVMIAASQHGVTHERIGRVLSVSEEGGRVRFAGEEHDSRVDPAFVSEIVVDRTSTMQGKTYPRVDLNGPGGGQLMSVVGFDGLEPFDAAVLPLGGGTALEPKPDEPRAERPEAAEDDPGAAPFDAALKSGGEVTIRFRRQGFTQDWKGSVEAVKPAMGLINVMRPDFHLHLRAGAVARWRESAEPEGFALVAEDGERRDLGLVVIGARGDIV